MRLKLTLATAIVGVALALPSISNAAPSPPQDSVSLTDGPAKWVVPSGTQQAFTGLSATSGPTGENPTGFVEYLISPTVRDYGPVTCLAVSGNSAILNYESRFSQAPVVTVLVVDDDPDTVSVLGIGRAATDCSPSSAPIVAPLISGDINVVDAQPQPTTREQCRNGGWRQFRFKSRGQCVVFVIQTRICDALEHHGIHLRICPPTPPRLN